MSNGIEWGSVADWVSGIGSMAAVFAALTIAFLEWRRARRNEVRSREAEVIRHAALTTEAIRIADDMRDSFQTFMMILGNNPKREAEGLARTLASFMDDNRRQLATLQQFPHDDPRIFVEIGRLMEISEISSTFPTTDREMMGTIANQKMEWTAQRIEALRSMPAQSGL